MSFWDRPNVVDNLTVLSSITEPGWGLKMEIPAGFGFGEIRGEKLVPYRVPTEDCSSNAVRGYQRLGKLFSGAAKLVEDDGTARGEISRLLETAERGVLNIRTTYERAGVVGTAQTFDDLKKDIDRARRAVGPAGQEPAGSGLCDAYAKYLTLRLQQGRYTSRGSAGVCHGFCLDWISRKLHPARNKASYAVSSHPDGQRSFDDRMRRKVERRIGPLQDAYEQLNAGHTKESRINKLLLQPGAYRGNHPEYYHQLEIVFAGADLWSYYQGVLRVHSWVVHEAYYPASGAA